LKISSFVIISEVEKLKYPYIESIKSFLPLCDEINVVYNVVPGFEDGSLEKIKAIGDPKIKLIAGIFDYDKFGWASQGIMRTLGYYACSGDLALMFDADGILHEKDVDKAKNELQRLYDDQVAYGFWMKHRINQRETWVRQCKHSGIYNKSIIGNGFNFFGGNGLSHPNWGILPEEQQRGRQTDVWIYGYERCWDDRKLFDYKLAKRRIMEASAHKVLGEEDYIQDFLDERREKNNNEGQHISIAEQPAIIQDKLREITEKQFGYLLFK